MPLSNRRTVSFTPDVAMQCCGEKPAQSRPTYPLRLAVCAAVVTIVLLVAILTPVLYYTMRPSGEGRRGPTDAAVSAANLAKVLGAWKADCPAQEVPPGDRFDCHPDPEPSEQKCVERGCCWEEAPPLNRGTPRRGAADIPSCFYPRNYGYTVSSAETQFYNGWEMKLTRLGMPLRYGDDVLTMAVRIEMQTYSRLRIKFYDPSEERPDATEPTIPAERKSDHSDILRNRLYEVSYNRSSIPFSLRVRRIDTGTIIFDTSVGGFTFGHQFLQLSTRLPSRNIYGLGAHTHRKLKHDLNWRTWTMFAQDALPEEGGISSGVHPMYLCLEDDGNTHALFLHNTYPLEVQLQPTPAVTFRALGGVLDFYIFLGPTPEDAMQQYTEAIGRPSMPPYWALGFQVSRSGFRSTDHVMQTVRRLNSNNISYDAVGLDTDYLPDDREFALNPQGFGDLPAVAGILHGQGRRLILTVEPTVASDKPPGSYLVLEEGLRTGAFVNDSWGAQPLQGKGRSGTSFFIDFGNINAHRWWTRQLEKFYRDVSFDGIWLDRNEPANLEDGSTTGCLKDNFNSPVYLPQPSGAQKISSPYPGMNRRPFIQKESDDESMMDRGKGFRFEGLKGEVLYSKTLCMDATQWWGQRKFHHLHLHNLYGHSMARATARSLQSIIKKRAVLLTRSTFAGSGKHTGHWLPNTSSEWMHMAWSITSLLEFNLFGIPYVGADICGYFGDAEEELCTRWIQLGAFYPMARSHTANGTKDQDPGSYSEVLVHVARKVMQVRYTLLPYLYTLFHQAHTQGSLVARPLFYEFYTDNRTYNIDRQFMWGPALLITPTLLKGARIVKGYLPEGWWFDYYSGKLVIGDGQWVAMDSALDKINLHLRGGHIIPCQTPANSTMYSRKLPMHLIVCLDEQHSAKGSLYWDDGETRDSFKAKEYVQTTFQVINDTLIVIGQKGRPMLKSDFPLAYFASVDVLGLPKAPSRITIGDQHLLDGRQVIWNPNYKVLKIKDILIPITETLEIQWHWT